MSFASTLGVLPPGVPLTGVGVSFTASIAGAETTTIEVTVSQFVGLTLSQIW